MIKIKEGIISIAYHTNLLDIRENYWWPKRYFKIYRLERDLK